MISLILATKGHRKKEIIRFIESISNTPSELYELIIVSQDESGYFDDLEKRYKTVPLTVLQSEAGLSKARNVGIKYAKGKFYAFPDDDCVYTENLIEEIIQFFVSNKKVDILSIDCYDLTDDYKLPFVAVEGDKYLTIKEIFYGVSSISIFHKRHEGILFDEKFGLGAKHKSSEEFDYVLHLMNSGLKLYHLSYLHVLHPDNNDLSFKSNFKKIITNSLGHGAYMRKNKSYLGYKVVLTNLILRPILGLIFYFITFRFKRSFYSLGSLLGRIKGYRCYED